MSFGFLDSRCFRKNLAMGVLCIDGDFRSIFRNEPYSRCLEWVSKIASRQLAIPHGEYHLRVFLCKCNIS